jgi:hypothetical protein
MARQLPLKELMLFEHLDADRAWTLIRDASNLNPKEVEHVESCSSCHEFLSTFVQLAMAAGFHPAVIIPPLRKDSKKTA